MNEIEVYRTMIEQANSLLERTVEGIPAEDVGKRPGPSLNPANFIYFHVLRHWDRDVNVLARGQNPAEDAWHRHGVGDEMGYNPDGIGLRGLGTGIGYSDEEVDAIPANLDALRNYQKTLFDETMSWLDGLDEGTIHEDKTSEYLPDVTYSVASRLQHLITHTCHHTGDLSYVKGAIGVPDPTYAATRG